jgi:hypothetical protein
MIDNMLCQQARFVAQHARTSARERIPAAFGNCEKATKALKAGATEKLDGTRYVIPISGKPLLGLARINDHPSCQSKVGVCFELLDNSLEVVSLEPNV